MLLPLWVWALGAAVLLVLAVLAGVVAWALLRPRPLRRIRLGNTRVSLWVRERRMPRRVATIVAPVAPDLRMIVGIAKWIRDATAGAAQRQADAVAPLQPGAAAIVGGGKYRFRRTALAVVTDERKRCNTELIRTAVANAIDMARGAGGGSVLIPDFTEDLLSQPRTVTDEQRRETCRPIAEAVLDAVRASAGPADEVLIWVWRPGVEDVWAAELERHERTHSHPASPSPAAT